MQDANSCYTLALSVLDMVVVREYILPQHGRVYLRFDVVGAELLLY